LSELNTYNKISLIKSVYEIEREINDLYNSVQIEAAGDEEVGSRISAENTFTINILQDKRGTIDGFYKNGKESANGKLMKKSKTHVDNLNLLDQPVRKKSEDNHSGPVDHKPVKKVKNFANGGMGDHSTIMFYFIFMH
jgi:hypothetical protein